MAMQPKAPETDPSGSSPLKMRAATHHDAAEVASLVVSADDVRQVSPLDSYPLTRSTVERWHAERNAGYVLEDETGIVAYGEVNADPHDSRRFWIGHVVVHGSMRGTGLGQQMVSSLAKLALERLGARQVWIGVFADNPPAHSCYVRSGFVEKARRRVMGRVLIDMRYDPPRLHRLLRRSHTAIFGAGAGAASAALLSSDARYWLMDTTGLPALPLVLGGSLVTGGLAWLAHSILPLRRTYGTEQLLRPVAFGLVLGTSAALLITALVHALAGPTTALGDDVLHALVGGVEYGGSWGLLLLIYSQARHWASLSRT